MAVPVNTAQTYNLSNIREDLTDAIYNISPRETILLSNAKRAQAKQVFHEWQEDSLAPANVNNAQVEGDDAPAESQTQPTRIGNYVQISRKVVQVSGTAEAVDKAGFKSLLAYQLAKKAVELKIDQEAIMLENQAADPGSASAPRKTGSLVAFIKTNSLSDGNAYSATAADPNAPSYTTVPNDARTDSVTLSAFTETMLANAMERAASNGAKPQFLMVGLKNKRTFSTFAGVATKTFYQSAVKETAVIGAADVYVSDFGILAVVPNRFQRPRDAFLIDPEYVAVMFLRPYTTTPLAKTGDSDRRLLIVEWGLKVMNEKAHVGIYDLA